MSENHSGLLVGGGPAFPSSGSPYTVGTPDYNPLPVFATSGPTTIHYLGMSRRDWLAGQALPALIARHRTDVPWGRITTLAYEIADAMIAEGANHV